MGVVGACSDYDLVRDEDAQGPLGPDGPQPGGDDTGRRPGDTDPQPTYDGAILGQVCDPSGDGWVVGATVYVEYDLDGDGTVDGRAETTTDSFGEFLLEDVPPGVWTVHVEKGSFSTTFTVDLTMGGLVELPVPECLQGSSARIAVVTGEYDDIGAILDGMSIPYDEYNGVYSWAGYLDFLKNPTKMAEYDIIFFNCGMDISWFMDQEIVADNVRAYVEAGGSIYTSDWAYFFLEAAFPDKIEFFGDDEMPMAAVFGNQGSIHAKVLDPAMRAVVGAETVDLVYPNAQWALAETASSGASVLVQGPAPTLFGSTQAQTPLAVRFQAGNGHALYTSFHNDAQATLDMEQILQEIVLSL